MMHYMASKKFISADFETISDKINNIIYSWAINNPYEKGDKITKTYVVKKGYAYGIDMKGFLEYIYSLKNKFYIFFHNGAKFDLSFILPTLKENGYVQYIQETNELISLKSNKWKDEISQPKRDLVSKEYTILLESNKIFELNIATQKNGRGNIILQQFRDSNLIFPNTLKGYGEQIGLEKKDNDNYKMKVYKSVKDLENDKLEFKYLIRDVDILQKYLENMHTKFDSRFWEITSAATAYKQWVLIQGENLLQNEIKEKKIKVIKKSDTFNLYVKGRMKPLPSNYWHRTLLKQVFPVDWQNEKHELYETIHSYMSNWYKGGITQVNPFYKGVLIDNIMSIDINSSYPSIMNSNLPLPYGIPVNEKIKGYDLGLFELEVYIPIPNTKGMPFIGTMSGLRLVYHKNLPEGIYYLTGTELKRFKRHYNYKGKCKIIGKYYFRSKPAKETFGIYIDKFYNLKNLAKQKNDKPNEIINKLLLNSLYGKFGTKSMREGCWFNPDNNLYEKDLSIGKANKYLPIAIWITAYARMKIVDAIDKKYKHFLYCDTDSIFIDALNFNKFNVHMDKEKLGAWDYELLKGYGIVRRAKQYLYYGENIKGEGLAKLAYAGLSINPEEFKKETIFLHFVEGTLIPDQIRGVRTPTGKVIEEYEKEIKPIWDKYYVDKQDWFKNEKEYWGGLKEQKRKIEEIRKKG